MMHLIGKMYEKKTMGIEVVKDDTLHKIYFPVHDKVILSTCAHVADIPQIAL